MQADVRGGGHRPMLEAADTDRCYRQLIQADVRGG
jgi:hypothetical protein